MKSYYELSIWSIFIDHAINSKPVLRRGWNTRTKSYYALFVWSVLINHDPLQMYSTNWAKYSKKIILCIIHLIYVYRSRHPHQICFTKWANYLKKIIVGIICFICIYQSRVTRNLFHEVCEIVEENRAMNYSFDLRLSITASTPNLFYEVSEVFGEKHTINYSLDVYWLITIRFKSVPRTERNIRRKSYYEVFVWSLLIYHDPLQICSTKWAKYSKNIIVWVISLMYTDRWRHPLQIYFREALK